MGVYLNPGGGKFRMSRNAQIYVDKSNLITELNPLIGTEDRYVCVSRPRRFGKTMAANMLSAYYGCSEDAEGLFDDLAVSACDSYTEHLNKHMVIQVNIQSFLSENDSMAAMLKDFQKEIIAELCDYYRDFRSEEASLPRVMEKIYARTKQTFIILIDEWDAPFREYQNREQEQRLYLDFLRNWLKDRVYVGLAYMTGILPVKKYGSHSALNMFNEYSVTSPGNLAPYFGFTEKEVERLCVEYGMSFEEAKQWYDGYFLSVPDVSCPEMVRQVSIYSPKSVVEAMKRRNFGNYWNRTETYEALKIYICMNFDGLKDAVTAMMAGGSISINTSKFSNDMTTFRSRDDVLTLLTHLGYLTYNEKTEKVRIPNKEVAMEYVNAIEDDNRWQNVAAAIERSENLLNALWNLDSRRVAEGIDKAHEEVSILQYNDENALSYTISLAFYYAREYYREIREMPAGRGYADICYLPVKQYINKPALLIELKWKQSAQTAIKQIKERKYLDAFEGFHGKVLLVGINYNRKTKKHECEIEEMQL